MTGREIWHYYHTSLLPEKYEMIKQNQWEKKPNVEKQNCCQHMLEFWGNYKKFWVNIPSRKLYILGISEPSLTRKWSHVKLFSTPFLVKGHSWWKTKENDVHVCLLLKVKWQRRRGIPLQDGFVSWYNALPNSHPVRPILWESDAKTLKYTQHQFNFFIFFASLFPNLKKTPISLQLIMSNT